MPLLTGIKRVFVDPGRGIRETQARRDRIIGTVDDEYFRALARQMEVREGPSAIWEGLSKFYEDNRPALSQYVELHVKLAEHKEFLYGSSRFATTNYILQMWNNVASFQSQIRRESRKLGPKLKMNMSRVDSWITLALLDEFGS
jgi:hypothetical protein